MTILALNLLESGVHLSMVCAIVGLAFAFFLIAAIKRLSPGNERMREISAAVQVTCVFLAANASADPLSLFARVGVIGHCHSLKWTFFHAAGRLHEEMPPVLLRFAIAHARR